MLKGRGRDPRGGTSPAPAHLAFRPPALAHAAMRPATPSMQRAAIRPEPDYEVVEFPSEQYVNAKIQPPPPPPPRPPTGHPLEAGASCGLCGGGGARVRCAECGRRALCASCDDMYHRHPKRRHHQRQALSQSQLRDERPPLPPKTAPPVPPPRKHKIGGDRMSASPKPPMMVDQRRATLSSPHHIPAMMGAHGQQGQVAAVPAANHFALSQQHAPQMPLHLQTKLTSTPTPNHLGSMPFLHANAHHAAATAPPIHGQSNTLSHMNAAWSRPRGSLQGFGMHPNMNLPPAENWENAEGMNPAMQSWSRPLRRGASVLELSGGSAAACAGCAHCAPMSWRYGSCASLDHGWPNNAPGWPPTCCPPGHPSHNAQMHPHPHMHQPQTPQPYRRAESRAVSRTGSRAGSRAASPAMSVRSRTSRRTKHRTPSPPPVPSSDADSESESESDHADHAPQPNHNKPQEKREESLGPAAPPPTTTWQCEHCTYVNEPGVRVCAICCRTPITAPKTIAKDVIENVERLRITSKESPSPARVIQEARVEREVRSASKPKKERTSTGCGPSPPREANNIKKPFNRLVTPTREQNTYEENLHGRNDMAVGPSPPRDVRNGKQPKRDMSTEISPPRDSNKTMRVSPFRDSKETAAPTPVKRHSISVGPSPPRENSSDRTPRNNVITPNVQKKSTGTSPPRDVTNQRSSSVATSKTSAGTSPPPQSISTQTYEVPNSTAWERASSVSRSRPRRRFRDDMRRERSQSRHSMSSDTRESDRSVRTAGASSRWEWRERDSSPGGEWGDNYNSRLSRRASHLDLRRARPNPRSSYYGSEAPSPERQSTRAISLEALAGAGARREAERGMELAQLMGEAERLGFSAAEVQAALTQSPAAPLAWLRERWPSLCAGVRAAAARLAPTAAITELEARAALARHRGAMWPAVTECVDRHRRQTDVISVGEEGRLRGHVWGSPAGADDDAAPPRSSSRQSHRLREDSSDEFEAPTPPKFQDDDWMYLPLNVNINDYEREANLIENSISDKKTVNENKEDVAKKLKMLLQEAGIPLVDEKLLLQGLLSGNGVYEPPVNNVIEKNTNHNVIEKTQPIDFIQSENDFIDAYNALTRSSPLPNINKSNHNAGTGNVNKPQVTNTSILEQKVLQENERSDDNVVLNNGILENHKQETPQIQHIRENVVNNEPLKINNEVVKNNNEPLEINHQEDEEINIRQQVEITSKVITSNQNPVLRKESPPKDLVIPTEIQKAIHEQDNPIQTDEKSNNLSTIVDSTQRLIQQMKDEINSDIHSIDGRTMSQSESESGSEESADEQESSFSESEERTDNLTSDEKEITSSEEGEEEEDIEPINNKVAAEQYGSSSEENDTFEEALDHVENQLEDFKHVNIEMLDSIARTLQEEHTFSVKVVDSNVQSVPKPPRKQDYNNNLFVAVNTFEEIYDDLTSQNNNYNNAIHEPVAPQNTVKEIETNNVKLLAKESILISQIKTIVPTKLIVSENIYPKLKAQVEYVEEPQSDSKENEIEITEETNNLPNTLNIPVNQSNQTINTLLPETNTEAVNNSLQITENLIINEVNDSTELVADVVNNNTNVDISQSPSVQIQQESKTPENVSNESTLDTSNVRNSVTNKSNIPKLIKIIPNNKPKSDKNSPKLIVSKVPVRRASIKQHPAPAPPKTHFGNITSGHVKQLQTRLFNNKVTPPKPAPTPPEEPEVKASTSTLNKKKQAPLPPTKHPQEKQISPPKTTPTKEKKQFFRETCRTEDEWTDSDSEDSQVQIIRPTEESTHRPPSPPPPITMRRVSGQIIDLAKVRLPEGSPERQARMLLAEGATETWEQAQLAVELISQGADPPAALLAALECADLTSALAYLYQDCELCASRLPEHEMVSMLRCTHRCCRECAHLYFTVQITERSIADCVCPYCKLPELESLPEDAWLEYFAHLDILLKTLLEIEVHELFQRKLRDRTLARDPNFRWCMECSSGFFVHPKQKRIRCPECRSISCASCRKPWTANHEGLSCEQYTAWLEDNDPERSVTAIQQHLRDNGLECPRCHFKYSLSRGGCMHFTCTQCKYEFCYGCGKPFTMGARCGLSDYCAKLGLHAHHPRNCLFYLRDKEPHELQTLLQMNNVSFEKDAEESSTGRCPVQLQRETPTGLVDGTCGSEAPTNYAGLCKTHYVEYLAGLARGLDPIPIMDVSELVAELRRRALPLPERGPWDSDPIYAGMCAEIVKEKIPLD